MRVLVTGGAGFIGSHTVDRLLAEGVGVVVLDDLRSGRSENISHHFGVRDFRFVRGDVRDSSLVRDLAKDVDGVVHLAALVSVPESFRDPVLVNDVNVGGTLSVLRACVDFSVKRFVFASSCAVYGEAEDLPMKEDCRLRPSSPYGISKLAAENYVRVFGGTHGLETVCLRFFNVYGPRQSYSEYSGVITRFSGRALKNLPLEIFGDGDQTRDFVHVYDVAEANMLSLRTQGVSGATFNIGRGVGMTISELANTVLEITGKTHLKLLHSEPRRGDIKHSVADISEARKKLHYNPEISLKGGLEMLFTA